MKKYLKRLGITAGLSLTLVAAACGSEDANQEAATGENNEDSQATEVSVGEQLDYTITGIDAGAGIMAATEAAIDAYGLDDYQLQPSSGAAMTSALDAAISNEEAIVVTGWTPHWKFAAYDLKYLEDPEGVFGAAESIHTIVREGLDSDLPEAYEVLDNFYWSPDHMGEIMVAVNEGADPAEAAAAWVEANQDIVTEWTNGVNTVDGDALTLAFVAWDSEIASTHMIGYVLESIGYDVTLMSMEPGPMFTAVATGSADAMVAAWLPGTHEAYYEDFKDDFVDLGANLDGAKIGLVVPAYMDITSIEDLKN
ncbi:glycine betaine ABC transporter substrate-binding protein [Alkalihalobacterium alkalinitrilicum]|uniref:glycine betaine ABC transporter substrate-binding protein n=1 Tax=Alkalihalobacterium alkalinitrilicum TaxID=427920 RepID=UPI0009954FDB|nr:glycine betaine ABC transporter substrate-binding protein [Alkalihalobacterium alkalinitrilicum]